MLAMDKIYDIRNRFYRKGETVTEICEATKHDPKTINKYLDKTDFNQKKPQPESEIRLCPKLDAFKPLIDKWLVEDLEAPRKQRHTAKRVYMRLKTEDEAKNTFDCSYRLVAQYVAHKKTELKLTRKEGYIPLEHSPGEAQADFGAARFHEDGKQWEGKYLTISFPYSNYGLSQLNYGENTECLFEGMVAIFEYIGGVPREIWFDNTSTIVTEIIKGKEPKVRERFRRFQEHYGFKAVFVAPGKGNEKGSVENKVGYSRRNFMVPVPRFISLADYNKQLLTTCADDGDREHYVKSDDIQELFKEDIASLKPLPQTPFDTSNIVTPTTNGYGKFTLNEGKHQYSVSPAYANKTVYVKLTSSHVIVMDTDYNDIVTHRRLYGDEKDEQMDWLLYLKFIARRPRSLRNSGIFDMMPDTVKEYIESCSNKDTGKILKALSELTERSGFDSAIGTVEQAILYEAKDADSLKNLYRRLYSNIPELPPLKKQIGIPEVNANAINLSDYDGFLKAGE